MSRNNTELVKSEIEVDVGKALKRPSQAKLTPAKRKKFLQEFAKHMNFTKAAQAIKTNRVSVYEALRSDETFAQALQEVKDAYLDTVEETSISIALQRDARGYNDRRMMLEAHRPEIYRKNTPDALIQIQVNSFEAASAITNISGKIPTPQK